MELDSTATTTKQLSRWVTIGILLGAIVLGLAVLYHINHSPRTDDAEVFANFIGIAPQVEGPIVRMNVRRLKCGESVSQMKARLTRSGSFMRLAPPQAQTPACPRAPH